MAKYVVKANGVTFEECPKTRAGFVQKWNSDYVFRNKAKVSGFNVVGDCVFLPNGKIAGVRVK